LKNNKQNKFQPRIKKLSLNFLKIKIIKQMINFMRLLKLAKPECLTFKSSFKKKVLLVNILNKRLLKIRNK